jgi:dihydrofolate reductase
MGRTTFEPAVGNPWWPWPGRRVYVVSSRPLPEGTPDDVVHVTGGPEALYERLRGDDLGGDVELLGGPSLIRAFWRRGWIDVLGVVILPVMFGGGLPLFPLDAEPAQTAVRLTGQRALPDGSMELFYERA